VIIRKGEEKKVMIQKGGEKGDDTNRRK
jgi:hypothetical protein